MRLVHLRRFPAQCVPVCLRGGAQIRSVKVAVLVEHFAEPHGDRRPCRPGDRETRPAREILAEIEQRFTRWCEPDRDGAQLADTTHRGRHRCDERRLRGRRFEHGHRGPRAVVEGRACPSAELPPRVIRFAAVDVRGEHRTRRGLPSGIRHDALGASALIANLELGTYPEPPAIEITLAEKPEIASVPAIAENRADDVCALPQQRGDVVGLVLEPAAVGRPAGCEELVTDALAVEKDLIEAQAGDVEARRAYGVADAKRTPQERRWRWKAIGSGRGRGDPLRGPVGRLQSCFPKCGRTPGRDAPARIPYAHAPVVPRARRHRRTGVVDKYRRVGGHLSRIPQRVGAASQARLAGRDLQLIRRLHRVAHGAGDPPAQPRLHDVDADGVGEVLDAQAADGELGE